MWRFVEIAEQHRPKIGVDLPCVGIFTQDDLRVLCETPMGETAIHAACPGFAFSKEGARKVCDSLALSADVRAGLMMDIEATGLAPSEAEALRKPNFDFQRPTLAWGMSSPYATFGVSVWLRGTMLTVQARHPLSGVACSKNDADRLITQLRALGTITDDDVVRLIEDLSTVANSKLPQVTPVAIQEILDIADKANALNRSPPVPT